MTSRLDMKFKSGILVVIIMGLLAAGIAVVLAASLSSMTLTLSSTTPDDTSVDHTFDFTKGTAGTIRGVRFDYCDAGSGTCTVPTGLDTTSGTLDAAGTDNEFDAWNLDVSTNGVIRLTEDTGDASNASPIIKFGDITNPSASGDAPTTFFVRITTYTDTGDATTADGPSQVASAVIPAITVSGTQDAILELTVTGVASSTSIGDTGDTKSTTATSTSSTLPFGTFAPKDTTGAESKAVAHTIKVVTNGSSGYSASVLGSGDAMFRAGGSELISYVGVDEDWAEATTAGFGVNAQDAAGAGDEANSGDFSVAGTYEYEPIDTAKTLASSSGPTSGVDTTVVYRVQVEATQAAGDYSGTVNYTVLPNF